MGEGQQTTAVAAPVTGFSHIQLNVADVARSADWYRTVLGMETMLEYGMMNGWDERTRAWARDAVSRQVPLHNGEDVVAKMAGAYFWQDPVSSAATFSAVPPVRAACSGSSSKRRSRAGPTG